MRPSHEEVVCAVSHRRDRPGIVADLAELIYECDAIRGLEHDAAGFQFAVLLL